MHHLVVTALLPKHKIGALITDPTEISRVLGCAEHRSVVKVFEHLTHAGVAQAMTKAAAEAEAAKAAEMRSVEQGISLVEPGPEADEMPAV